MEINMKEKVNFSIKGGDVNDSINCILKNLTEMNNLWIRMQGNKEKSKREKERVDLKITVGENLSRLSKLQGVNKEIYLE
jgi:vacuolar protein sorting-associated protein 35